jgi:ABC-2 type transport system permease protein
VVVFQHTQALAGWTLPQALLFVSGYLVVDAVHMTLFSTNLHFFPTLVNKGELDSYLLRPVSPLFFLSLREFAFNSFVNLVMALGILGWALWNLDVPFGPLDAALYAFMLVVGILIHYLIHMLMLLQVFWTHSADGAAQLHYNLMKFMERPDRIFPAGLRYVLMTILPYSLIASFPARAFFGEDRMALATHVVVAAACLSGLLLFLWRRGLRAYSSASS